MLRQTISRTCRYVKPGILWITGRPVPHYNSLAPRLLVHLSGAPLSKNSYSTSTNWTDDQFNDVVNKNKIVVFMKGTPDAPQCGFSKYVIQILSMHGCEDFNTFNVLDDDVLRSRVKEFSNWPTIPQIYINGEFIGGFDILLQMHQGGDLIEELEKIGHRSALIDAESTDEK